MAEHTETTTTVTEVTTEYPDPIDEPVAVEEMSPEMSQTILDRLDAMDLRLSDLAARAETPDVVIIEDDISPEPEPDTEPVEIPEDEPVTDDPVDDPEDDEDGPTEDAPYEGRPEIEPNGQADAQPETDETESKPKKKKRERAPRQDLGWRGALLGGSGGMRGNRRG